MELLLIVVFTNNGTFTSNGGSSFTNNGTLTNLGTASLPASLYN